MPNLKSAKKRMRKTEKQYEHNVQVRTRVKNARRVMLEAVDAGDAEAVDKAYRAYCSVLDKAAKKGIIKKNTAVRRKTNAANGLRKLASA